MTMFTTRRWHQPLLAFLLLTLLLPMAAPFANAQIFTRKAQNNTPKQGMSLGKKVVLLSGAALLYFLWKKHQANAAQKAQVAQNGQVAPNGQVGAQPQLYRSKNGGIYYRDAQGTAVWLTVPNQAVQVPATDVRRYAPDYNRYRGPAPTAPNGYTTKSFSEFDDTLLPATGNAQY